MNIFLTFKLWMRKHFNMFCMDGWVWNYNKSLGIKVFSDDLVHSPYTSWTTGSPTWELVGPYAARQHDAPTICMCRVPMPYMHTYTYHSHEYTLAYMQVCVCLWWSILSFTTVNLLCIIYTNKSLILYNLR